MVACLIYTERLLDLPRLGFLPIPAQPHFHDEWYSRWTLSQHKLLISFLLHCSCICIGFWWWVSGLRVEEWEWSVGAVHVSSTFSTQATKIELAIATGTGSFMFSCYGLVCAWLLYLSRNTKDDATVKRRVFMYSLCTCISMFTFIPSLLPDSLPFVQC